MPQWPVRNARGAGHYYSECRNYGRGFHTVRRKIAVSPESPQVPRRGSLLRPCPHSRQLLLSPRSGAHARRYAAIESMSFGSCIVFSSWFVQGRQGVAGDKEVGTNNFKRPRLSERIQELVSSGPYDRAKKSRNPFLVRAITNWRAKLQWKSRWECSPPSRSVWRCWSGSISGASRRILLYDTALGFFICGIPAHRGSCRDARPYVCRGRSRRGR